jgi:RNA polymerase sigma-70 factor (ECF subfamily)
MENEDFINLLKSGDHDAFAEFVSGYRKSVINICYRFLLNREDAEDISQEVFIEAFYSLKKFRGESRLSTWIYRIAVTKSLDEIKKQKRKKRIGSIGKTLGLEQIATWITDNGRPDKILEENEDLSKLLTALDSLPENQRIALTLSKIDGCATSEIAEVLQTTTTAVDSLIYRAKQNLKTFLTGNRQIR